jgi:hypothetical protein
MRISFSLKALLAAMAYVALAAAAISTKSWPLAVSVSVFSILAFCYAVFVGLAWDERRGVALGFILLFAANAWAVLLAPRYLPSSQLLHALGYNVSAKGAVLVADAGPTVSAMYPPPAFIRPAVELTPIIRTANAAGTMGAGLLGCLLGAVAFPAARYGPLRSLRD